MSCGCECIDLPAIGSQHVLTPDGAPTAVTIKRCARVCFTFLPTAADGPPPDVDVPSFLGRQYQSCVGVLLSTSATPDTDNPLAKGVVISVGCGRTCVRVPDDIKSLSVLGNENGQTIEGLVFWWDCADVPQCDGCDAGEV